MIVVRNTTVQKWLEDRWGLAVGVRDPHSDRLCQRLRDALDSCCRDGERVRASHLILGVATRDHQGHAAKAGRRDPRGLDLTR